VFDRADELILDRQSNRHSPSARATPLPRLPPARLELRVAFEEIFRRIPQFSVPPDAKLEAFGGQTRSLVALLCGRGADECSPAHRHRQLRRVLG